MSRPCVRIPNRLAVLIAVGVIAATAAPRAQAPTMPAPRNLTFEGGRILTGAPASADSPLRLFPRLRWDAVPGAVGYEVWIAWSSGTPIVRWMPVMSLDYPFPMGQPGHQYQVKVRAYGNPMPGAGAQASDTQGWFGTAVGEVASITIER